MSLYQKITTALRWNTFEAIAYQVLLCSHQLLLLSTIPAVTYGLMGTLFATTYFTASLISGGFEYAITPFFTQACSSRQAYKALLISPFVQQLALASTILIGFIGIGMYGFWSSPILQYGSYLIPLALSEGTRKILKTLAQLSLKARPSAYIELALLTTYVSTVWSWWYMSGCAISIPLLFIPLIITSLLTNVAYLIIIARSYYTLPSITTPHPPVLAPSRLWHSRAINFINQLGHSLFSGNFLVPWIALHLGLEQAGIFKILSYVCSMITPLIQKIVGLQSQVLFAHIKHNAHIEKTKALTLLNKKLFILLSLCLTLILINVKTILTYHGTHITMSLSLWISLFLFILFMMSENLVVVYERFCIAFEHVEYLLFYAALSCIGFFGIIMLLSPLSITTLLLCLLAVRVCSFGVLIMLIEHATLLASLRARGRCYYRAIFDSSVEIIVKYRPDRLWQKHKKF
jgi:hypothetical protein